MNFHQTEDVPSQKMIQIESHKNSFSKEGLGKPGSLTRSKKYYDKLGTLSIDLSQHKQLDTKTQNQGISAP